MSRRRGCVMVLFQSSNIMGGAHFLSFSPVCLGLPAVWGLKGLESWLLCPFPQKPPPEFLAPSLCYDLPK